MTPDQVGLHNSNRVFKRLFRPFAGLLNTRGWKVLPIGTTVRLRLNNRGPFTKTNQPRNSQDLFRVSRIRLHPRRGIAYKIQSYAEQIPVVGTFDESELLVVETPQK